MEKTKKTTISNNNGAQLLKLTDEEKALALSLYYLTSTATNVGSNIPVQISSPWTRLSGFRNT